MKNLQRREPFSEIGEWTTDAGTHLEVGETVLVKPTYINERLPAVVESLYWDPQGLPGGTFDHRGEPDDDGNYPRPDQYDCQLKGVFRFDVPEDDEYAHMDGKMLRTEEFNFDFLVGSGRKVRRDRANCNVEGRSDA